MAKKYNELLRSAYIHQYKRAKRYTKKDSSSQDNFEDDIKSSSGNLVISANELGRQATIKSYEKMKATRTAKSAGRVADSFYDVSDKTVDMAKRSFKNKEIKKIYGATTKTGNVIKDTFSKGVDAVKKTAQKATDLLTYMIAGGWLSGTALFTVMLLSMMCASVYGVYFAKEDSGTGITTETVRLELLEEYDEKIQEIINADNYESVEIVGELAPWDDVLQEYAKRMLEGNSPQEVATMNNEKAEILKEVFWDMNIIETDVQIVPEELPTGDGTILIEHKSLTISIVTSGILNNTL